MSLSLLVGCHHNLEPGPLEPPTSEAIETSFSGFRQEVAHIITFGFVFPVKNYGEEPAILDEVALEEATNGIALEGGVVADITGLRHTWSGDVRFPPRHPGGQEPLAGFTIAPDASQVVQILIGIRLTEPGQAGFKGVAIHYHVGDQHYRYLFPAGAALCSESFYAQHPEATSCSERYLFREDPIG